ncbi:hypothetical protein [Haloplanus salilacus]|uniref:hypothetical protein n=1 Tax=Haloplanus salilacus TaxID=2949994 RepID=UPI0030CB7C6A
MATVTQLVAELLRSVVDLVVIFATEVAPQDPIGLLVFLAGAVLTTVAAGFLGLLAVGALLDALRDAVAG